MNRLPRRPVHGTRFIDEPAACGRQRPDRQEGAPASCVRFNDLNFSGHRHDGTHALHGHRHEVLHDRFFGQSSFGQYAVANERNVVKVRKDAPLEEGARLLLGGEPDGNVVPPHVFTDVDPASSIARDESFGPLLPIIKARDEAHALELANDTEFGLSSAVFTGANERGVRFALGIVAGMTHINDISVDDQPNAPFGGEKNSGLGRFNGEWAMEEFTRTQWITVQSKARPYPF